MGPGLGRKFPTCAKPTPTGKGLTGRHGFCFIFQSALWSFFLSSRLFGLFLRILTNSSLKSQVSPLDSLHPVNWVKSLSPLPRGPPLDSLSLVNWVKSPLLLPCGPPPPLARTVLNFNFLYGSFTFNAPLSNLFYTLCGHHHFQQ